MTLLLLVGCSKDNGGSGKDMSETFLKKEEPGMFGYGGYLFKYNKESCQVAVNVKKRQIRLQNDEHTSYVNVLFPPQPLQPDAVVTLRLTYKLGGDEICSDMEMQLLKESDGKMWLWNSASGTGLVLPAVLH